MSLLIFLSRAWLLAWEFLIQSVLSEIKTFKKITRLVIFQLDSRQTEWIKVPMHSALFLLLWVNIIWIANFSACVSENLTN